MFPQAAIPIALSEISSHILSDKIPQKSSFSENVQKQLIRAFNDAKAKAVKRVKLEQQETLILLLNMDVFRKSFCIEEAIEKAKKYMYGYPEPEEIIAVATIFEECFHAEILQHPELCRKLNRDDIFTIYKILDEKANKNQLSRDNLLHNWFFLNPINQRGQKNYNARGYCMIPLQKVRNLAKKC